MTPFASIDDVALRLQAQGYICDRHIASVVFLATRLGKPVLVEGPAGVGKTELAKAVAAALGCAMERLQCYEGLDESKALYEWEYPKQLLYTQILKDKLAETLQGAGTLAEAIDRVAAQQNAFFSERFLVPRPILKVIQSAAPMLLLLDEVDKSDPEFEAFLLEILSDFQVTVPEIGTLRAKSAPVVFLTSNDARDLSDALKRRCLHLWIDFPAPAIERAIVASRVPALAAQLAAQLVGLIAQMRGMQLKKAPSIAETLDWARALVVLNARELSAELVQDTLDVVLKYETDIHRVRAAVPKLMSDASVGS